MGLSRTSRGIFIVENFGPPHASGMRGPLAPAPAGSRRTLAMRYSITGIFRKYAFSPGS